MFTEQERRIFQYFDGQRSVFADPVAVHRRLTVALDGCPNRFLEQARDGADPFTADAAKERILAAVRQVFAMAPFDPGTGEGALEEDCWAALDGFLAWVEAQKKTGAT